MSAWRLAMLVVAIALVLVALLFNGWQWSVSDEPVADGEPVVQANATTNPLGEDLSIALAVPVAGESPDASQSPQVASVRALAQAGNGQAAWQMAQDVVACHGRTLQSDDEAMAELRARWVEHGRMPEPEFQQMQMDAVLETARRFRSLCPQMRDDDLEQIPQWLETALAAGDPGLLHSLSVQGPALPRDRAWLVRHAERLAVFLERARVDYPARLEAGDVSLLPRSRGFYKNQQLWPDGNEYQAYVHLIAASQLPEGSSRFPVQDFEFRFTGQHLDEAQRQRAEQEGLALFQRCCAGR